MMCEKQKIVIIGASEFQNPLILRAKELGYETHVFAWECGDIGETTADYFHPISIIEKDKILEECQKIHPVGVCSIASDLATSTISYVSEKLGLTSNDYKDNFMQTNKYAMREAFKKAGISCPAYAKVNSETNVDTLNLFYPLIVKPTDRSGSRGICKVNNKEELKSAIQDSCNDSYENSAIVEEYISGPEYSCECISYQGRHYFLQFTQKFTTGNPHFIETGHQEPADIPIYYYSGIISDIFQALTALNVKNGASHTEFKLQKDGSIRIIEIGARMGGDCIGSNLVEMSTGFDFLKMVIDISCGRKPDFTPLHSPGFAKIQFVLSNDDVCQYNKILKEYPEKIVYSSTMDFAHIDKTKDSSTRCGFYILNSPIS